MGLHAWEHHVAHSIGQLRWDANAGVGFALCSPQQGTFGALPSVYFALMPTERPDAVRGDGAREVALWVMRWSADDQGWEDISTKSMPEMHARLQSTILGPADILSLSVAAPDGEECCAAITSAFEDASVDEHTMFFSTFNARLEPTLGGAVQAVVGRAATTDSPTNKIALRKQQGSDAHDHSGTARGSASY